ncbi:MAG: class I SAM-dependent methyltransferase [Verrucomicrobia bacterium]|nr:class I SAM-dependent methyltransferase [Verrucomicrobiota bacterium]
MSNFSLPFAGRNLGGALRRWARRHADFLHPWRHVTGAAGHSHAAGLLRRAVTRKLYDHLARAYPTAEWTTMNYGYAALPGETPGLAVDPRLPEHLALQLYLRLAVALQSDGRLSLSGCEALEIGSGRGGGAAYVARHFRPRRFVALDVSAEATALARRQHGEESTVEFVHGDAENLPFTNASFDVVINVESAHCYGSINRFLVGVHRVLRPGGRLALADFASERQGARARLLATLRQGPLRLLRVEEITANVVAALAQDEARKRALLDRWVKGWFRSFAQGAYAMEGSAMQRELAAGRTVYLVAVLEKAATGTR